MSEMKPILAGKVVLLTGATSGFGLRLAEELWNNGASLILLARDMIKLAQVKSDLDNRSLFKGQFTDIVCVDLANQLTLESAVEPVLRSHGGLHVLINNAGILGPVGVSWDVKMDEFQLTLQVNLIGPVSLCNIAVRHMLGVGYGKIINLSGGGATSPRPYVSAYGTAKAAIVRYSEILAEELKGRGIDVNCIAPGIMNTAMVRKVFKAGSGIVGEKEFLQAADCIGSSNSNMERAAKLIVFLASSRSDGISGKLISAVWDPWERLADYRKVLGETDIYTLRRIVPADRGREWEE